MSEKEIIWTSTLTILLTGFLVYSYLMSRKWNKWFKQQDKEFQDRFKRRI